MPGLPDAGAKDARPAAAPLERLQFSRVLLRSRATLGQDRRELAERAFLFASRRQLFGCQKKLTLICRLKQLLLRQQAFIRGIGFVQAMAPKNRAFDPNRKEMPERIMASFEGHMGVSSCKMEPLRAAAILAHLKK